MLISNKIRNLAKIKRFSLSALATEIGMTKTGFYQALDIDDFKVGTLQKISDVLGVEISFWFRDMDDEVATNKAKENSVIINGGNNHKVSLTLTDCQRELEKALIRIQGLEKELEAKNEIIELLKQQIKSI